VELSKASHDHWEVLVSHANATLTPAGRLRLARCVVDQGWTLARASERFSVSKTTAKRWADRYRHYGAAGLTDHSSRPRRSPRRTARRLERRIVGLRVSRRWGPARIAAHLSSSHPAGRTVSASTVHAVLTRYGCPPLAWTDPATGAPLRRTPRVVHRYEHHAPGDLVHVDVKKLGRIPDGGGHKVHGRPAGRKIKGSATPGYAYLHHAVDDHSRLAYSEILTDERKETAAAFWTRAAAWFTSCGVSVRRVLTDNGSAYRSRAFRDVLAAGSVIHKRTRPYRPQTNGKVERFNRTLLTEWAYARPYASEAERAAAYPDFLHTYNHHRPHTALKGRSPADRVTNLSGQNT
jgi:transposase InsO family protein